MEMSKAILNTVDKRLTFTFLNKEYVVDVNKVWPLIPITDETYQKWLSEGNKPLEQSEEESNSQP